MLKIKMLKRLIISTIGVVALSGCSLLCGPNRSDVRVMKPMAQKISDYIVKNGIPETLKDIPDLPYALMGCEKKRILDYKNETCIFKYKEKLVYVNFETAEPYSVDNIIYEKVNLIMKNNVTETGMYSFFVKKNNNPFKQTSRKFYNAQTEGRCAPMKQ